MCGIIVVMHGDKVAHQIKQALNRFVGDAVIAGSVRGDDSTGMFQLREWKNELHMYRAPYNGAQFAEDIKAKSLINNVDCSKATVVHHRAATFGGICTANAHPFQHASAKGERRVIGVHNGHVSNWKVREGDESFSVDSDWAFYKIYQLGAKKAIESFEGAMSLAWMEEDANVRLYSNGKRPLFWNYLKDENVLIATSEHEMMYWLAGRQGLTLEKTMWEPRDDKIYTFDPSNPRKFTTENIVPKKETPVQLGHNNGVNRDFRGQHTYRPHIPDQSMNPTNGTGTSSNPSCSINRTSLAKTVQGKDIFYDLGDVRKQGFDVNEEVEFHFSTDIKTDVANNIFGDLMVDEGNFDLSKNGKIRVVPAIMIAADSQLKENIKLIGELGGSCWCKVIGTSIIVDPANGESPCMIVSRPTYLKVGDDEVIMRQSFVDVQKRKEELRRDLLAQHNGLNRKHIPAAGGILVSTGEFFAMVQDGCEECKSPFRAYDAFKGKIVWDKDCKPYCTTCAFMNNIGTAADAIKEDLPGEDDESVHASNTVEDSQAIPDEELQTLLSANQEDLITQRLIAEQNKDDTN